MPVLSAHHDTALYFVLRFEAEWITRLNQCRSLDKKQLGKDLPEQHFPCG